MRIRPTSTLRLYWLMLPTLLSAMIQGSTGFVTPCTSTESSVDSLLLGRNTGVYVERVTAITKQDLQEGQPGRETTHCLFEDTVNARRVLYGTNNTHIECYKSLRSSSFWISSVLFLFAWLGLLW